MSKKPLVLLSNDDGIHAEGLRYICDSLSEFAEIIVAAPATQQSGKSHAISIHGGLTARQVRMKGARAYAINGTPADCVKLGLLSLCKKRPELVVSGINHGPNFGKFIIYSGTIGAAAEAALLGIPALSLSLDDYHSKAPDFTRSAYWGSRIAKLILYKVIRPDKHTIVNVNIPGPSSERIKGLKVIPMDQSEYEEYFSEKKSGKTTYFNWRIDERVRKKCRGITDTDAVRDGYVSVTPLHFELTHNPSLSVLRAQFKKAIY